MKQPVILTEGLRDKTKGAEGYIAYLSPDGGVEIAPAFVSRSWGQVVVDTTREDCGLDRYETITLAQFLALELGPQQLAALPPVAALIEALEPFAWLARVMEPDQILNHRGVYITQAQAQAAADAVARARGEDDA